MAINEDDLERLRASLVLSDVVQRHLALRRVGRNWVGLCPFHAERSGSFNVRDETGRYRCFGCGAAGDVFKFDQQRYVVSGHRTGRKFRLGDEVTVVVKAVDMDKRTVDLVLAGESREPVTSSGKFERKPSKKKPGRR